jgi:hypothetical protein
VKCLTLLLFLLSSNPSFAQWSATAIQIEQKISQGEPDVKHQGPLGGPYWSSLLDGLVLASSNHPLDPDEYVVDELNIILPDRQFVNPEGQPLPCPAIYYHTKGVQRAPLVVYLPGIFQSQNSGASQKVVKDILRAGASVLLIPNSLTSEYMSHYPVSPPTYFLGEAEVALAETAAFVAQHKSEISNVNVMGLGYGALIAAIFSAQDAQQARPLLRNGQTTLISPPQQMGVARDALDQTLYVLEQWQWSGEALLALTIREALTGALERIQQRFFADRDRGYIARHYRPTVAGYLTRLNLKDRYTVQRLRLAGVIRDAIEVTAPMFTSEQGTLAHWLAQMGAHGNSRWRILTTDDDFLNGANQWRFLPQDLLGNDHLLIHRGGGHAGMVDSEWFSDLLAEAFH